MILAEITAIDAQASSIWKGREAKFALMGNDQPGTVGIFHSEGEDNPWLRIKLNRKVIISSVTIRNRLDCCGERLVNLEVRAGTKYDLTNEVVGTFAGPGATGQKHLIQFSKWVFADVLTFQLKKKNEALQINGIYLNEELTTIGKNIF